MKTPKAPTPGAYLVRLLGSKRWRLAERRKDHLWYVAGYDSAFAVVSQHVPIPLPAFDGELYLEVL